MPNDNYSDDVARDKQLKILSDEISDFVSGFEKYKKSTTDELKAVRELTVNGDNSAETTAKIEELSKSVSENFTKQQKLADSIDIIKKEMGTPFMRGGKDLKDADVKSAIFLQKQLHLQRMLPIDQFVPDMNNLVPVDVYRSAARKSMNLGILQREDIRRSMTPDELKVYEKTSMDTGFIVPQVIGIIDCDDDCASLIDLYDSVSVSKTTNQFGIVDDYSELGSYECGAPCSVPGSSLETFRLKAVSAGQFRGALCFERKVLEESSYDLLSYAYTAIDRSHRINRNRNLIVGPDGWLTQNCFIPRTTSVSGQFNPGDYRAFTSSVSWEYGPVMQVMHQNVFSLLVSTPTSGGFVFEQGKMCIGPSDVSDCIRISNCLPDPTAGGTLSGTEASPFPSGAFIMAAGNFQKAYKKIEKRPLYIEQSLSGSTLWCSTYQFTAEDGGFVQCCNAASILRAA